MTFESSSTGETVIREPDHRASALCRVLGGRRISRGGVRYFLPNRSAEQFAALYAAGYWPVNRRGCVAFMRDPTPLGLYDALRVARATQDQKPLDSAVVADRIGAMTLHLPYFWSGMDITAKAGYLCSTRQAKDYEDACRILRGMRRPAARKYPKPDPVALMERQKLF